MPRIRMPTTAATVSFSSPLWRMVAEKIDREMVTSVADYFQLGCGRCDRFATAKCSTKLWADGLAMLRQICLEAGLDETAKWGHPCFMHKQRNIAIIGAFQGEFRLTFFNAALLEDPQNVLQKQGPNTQHADAFKFTSTAQVEAQAATISAYLQEAIGYADAGIKPPKIAREIDVPEELLEALDADPELSEAWHSLTPGRQRSYCFNLNTAKKSETRVARIIKFRDKIIAGKGANEY